VTTQSPKELRQILSQKAKPIDFPLTPQVRYFIVDMKKYYRLMNKPVGLAAPQVGKPWRIIIIEITEEMKKYRDNVFKLLPLTAMINPSYTPIHPPRKYKDWEGCFSVPDKMGEITRYFAIRYQYFDENGYKVIGSARGLLARVIQHEVDHLNGILFPKRATKGDRYGAYERLIKIRMRELKRSRETKDKK